MARYALQVVEVTGKVAGVMRRAVAGTFISAFDPDAHDGRGEASYTRNPRRAVTFDSPTEAMAYWQQTSTVRPLREDGEPNRPLTAISVALVRLPDAKH